MILSVVSFQADFVNNCVMTNEGQHVFIKLLTYLLTYITQVVSLSSNLHGLDSVVTRPYIRSPYFSFS